MSKANIGLFVYGQALGQPVQTATGFIQSVLVGTEVIKVYSKNLNLFQPDSDGNVLLPVNAKDNFVFAIERAA